MSRAVACMLALSIPGLFPGVAPRVQVVDRDGKEIAGATSACVEPGCARVRCEAEGYLPAEVERAGAITTCVLTPALRLAARVSGCPAGCRAGLFRGETADAVAVADVTAGEPGEPARAEFPPLAPGPYEIAITRESDGWSCRAPLGVVGPGRKETAASWSAPAPVGGTVTGPDDRPLADVLVRAWTRMQALGNGPGMFSCGPRDLAPARTGPSGGVEFQVDPRLDVLLVAGGWDDPLGIDAAIARPGSPPPVLRPGKPGRIGARVVGRGDAPVPCKAALTMTPDLAAWLGSVDGGSALEATCDGEGGFSLGPLLPGPYAILVLAPDGLPLEQGAIDVRSGEFSDLGILRAVPGDAITVRVVGPDREPVPGAEVCARGAETLIVTSCAQTGQDGAVDLGGLPLYSRIRLTAEAEGLERVVRDGVTARSSPVVLRLQPGLRLAGRVLDPWGAPVADASVNANPRRERVERAAPRGPSVQADEQGEFLFDTLGAGDYVIEASAPGFAPSDPAQVSLERSAPSARLELRLRDKQELRGTVLDPDGAPVAGGRVVLFTWCGPWSATLEERRIAETTTQAGGSFRIAAPDAPECLAIGASAPNLPISSQRLRPETTGEITLRLQRPAGLLARTAKPPRGGEFVSVMDASLAATAIPLDGSGTARFATANPGTAQVFLLGGRGTNLASAEAELKAGEVTEVLLDEAEDASKAVLRGTVSIDGTPWPMAVVALTEAAHPGYIEDLTGADGRFEFRDLDPGLWIVIVSGGGGRAVRRITLAPGERKVLDIPLARVIVRVALRNAPVGQPPRTVDVSDENAARSCLDIGGTLLHGADYDTQMDYNDCGPWQAEVGTGESLLLLPRPGRYRVNVRRDAALLASRVIDAHEGENLVEFDLEPTGDETRLTVQLPTADGTVACVAAGAVTLAFAQDGSATCSGLPAGDWQVFFCAYHVGFDKLAVHVEPGTRASITMRMPLPGTLQVPVPGGSQERPAIVDGDGIPLAALPYCVPPRWETCGRPAVPCWIVDGLAPGSYTVTVEGRTRRRVQVIGGQVSIAE
ncbi:MAG: carboxypeptidase regulatory-like domain-containing protein [Acidobacteria bacterium]|nr:carboxypeptidase regulatory-like domain-containing protein [Acidobacteriota bacterium]